MKHIDSNLFAHDPKSVFYATPELTQRLNLIHHLLGHSEQLLLVLAEAGHGKTTLCHQVQAAAEENWKLLPLAATAQTAPEGLLLHVLAGLAVKPAGRSAAAMTETLRSQVAAVRYNGQLPVLIVDDAHMLPLETLSLLIQLAMTGDNNSRLRVILFCEPQITSVFAAPEFEILRRTLIHTLDIPPFTEKQLRGYIQFCLHQARFNLSQSPFSDMATRYIFQQSEGVPAQINRLARQMLAQHVGGLGNLQHKPLQKWLYRISMALLLGLLLAGLALGGAWLKGYFQSAPPPVENPPLELPLPVPGQEPESQPQTSPPQTPPQPVEPAVAPQPAAAPSEPAKAVVELPATPSTSAAPASAQPPAAPSTAPSTPLPTTLDAEEMSELAGVKSETWLRSQPQESYTIQILGTHEKEALEKFMQKHKLRGDVSMFRTAYKNRDWHVLLYGIYPDRSRATAAIDELPASLRQATQPWVRSLGSVHAELEKRGQ
jgi:DamX protein